MAAPKAQYREKLVAIVSRRECVYKRAGKLSVTFHERGETPERVTDSSIKKIGTEQSLFRLGAPQQPKSEPVLLLIASCKSAKVMVFVPFL